MFSILRLCAIIGLSMQENMGFGNVTSTSKTMKIIDTKKKISVLIVEGNLLVQKICKTREIPISGIRAKS